jgi:triosephosphate isomerase
VRPAPSACPAHSPAGASAAQLHDAGIPWVLAGHSERRTLFHEDDATVAQKARAALDAGVGVILCVGETLAEREAAQTDAVCRRQLQAAADVLSAADWACVARARARARRG